MDKITHRELVDVGAKWLNKKASNIYYRSQYVVTEFSCQGVNEKPDIFGLRPYGHVIIEVKTSRADFKRDFKKRGRRDDLPQLGNFRFYLAPQGLIKVEELPDYWGLLEWDGREVILTKEPKWVDGDWQGAGYVYHSLLRRMHKPQVFDFRKVIHMSRDQIKQAIKGYEYLLNEIEEHGLGDSNTEATRLMYINQLEKLKSKLR